MKAKKTLKIIGKALLVLLILIVLFLLTTTVLCRIRQSRAMGYLNEKGYFNPVSAGEYDVNVYCCGNENGKHTIVALAGYLDGEMYIGWRKMTAPLEEENRLVFLDRAGYGASGDYNGDMTVEHVVEHYRAALQNAGIPAPYVLLPHSYGGLYATFWESKYPDEIEAAAFLDGTQAEHFDLQQDAMDFGIVKWVSLAGKLGLLPPLIRSEYGKEFAALPEEGRAAASALLEKTMSSKAATTEIINLQKNTNFVWDEMAETELPKLYLSVLYAFHTKEQLIAEGLTADFLRNSYGVKGDTDDEVYANYLNGIADHREDTERYIARLGNCQTVELPGQHEIMFDQPEECSRILLDFLHGLES